MIIVEEDRVVVDITKDLGVLEDDCDDNDVGVSVSFGESGLILRIGRLDIRLTEAQEEMIRFYYENT